MSDALLLGFVNALVAFLVALLGLLVEYHRREGKRERARLETKLGAILDKLDQSLGDLRRSRPGGR